jgi:hypothetical protein
MHGKREYIISTISGIDIDEIIMNKELSLSEHTFLVFSSFWKKDLKIKLDNFTDRNLDLIIIFRAANNRGIRTGTLIIMGDNFIASWRKKHIFATTDELRVKIIKAAHLIFKGQITQINQLVIKIDTGP